MLKYQGLFQKRARRRETDQIWPSNPWLMARIRSDTHRTDMGSGSLDHDWTTQILWSPICSEPCDHKSTIPIHTPKGYAWLNHGHPSVSWWLWSIRLKRYLWLNRSRSLGDRGLPRVLLPPAPSLAVQDAPRRRGSPVCLQAKVPAMFSLSLCSPLCSTGVDAAEATGYGAPWPVVILQVCQEIPPGASTLHRSVVLEGCPWLGSPLTLVKRPGRPTWPAHPLERHAATPPWSSARSRVVALHCRFGAVGFAHGGARRWEDRGGAVPSFISRSRESKGGWDRGKSRGARWGCCGGYADVGHGR
jgi:hypothetical protein